MDNRKAYIGDGVYVRLDEQVRGVILTTENGISANNVVYLENEVLQNLLTYVKEVYAAPDTAITRI